MDAESRTSRSKRSTRGDCNSLTKRRFVRCARRPRSTPLLGLGSLEWSGSAEFKPARPLKMKLDPSTMEVAGIFKPAEVERPVTPRSAASNTSSVEGGIFGANTAVAPEGVASATTKSSVAGGIFGHDENAAPAARAPSNKRYSNASSIPGGIFG